MVLAPDGALVGSRSIPIPISRPDATRVEQDPRDLVNAVLSAAGPLVDAYGIDAAGLDNQGESFVLWDADSGEALTPSIVWQDQRGQGVCESLKDRVDGTWLRERTGLTLDSYFCAPKIAQLLLERPDLKQAARHGTLRFGTTDSWILHRLGQGLHVTDPSTASRTLLFNLRTLDWDEELLNLFDIPRSLLPRVVPSAGYVGGLRLSPARAPVALWAMLTDQQAALFGQACFAPGEAKCTFGTGAFLLAHTGSTPRISSHGLLSTVAWHTDKITAYALDGGIFCAGAAVQWLAEGLKIIDNVAASEAAARSSTDTDVVVVPCLAGLSAPRWWTHARGAAFGLSPRTTGADLARATLEGLACQVVDVVRAMERDTGEPLEFLRVDGGPTRNAYLMQFLADVLGINVHVAQAQEATASGVAHLAQHALTGIGLEALASRWRCQQTYEPCMTALHREAVRARWDRAIRALGAFHDVQPCT